MAEPSAVAEPGATAKPGATAEPGTTAKPGATTEPSAAAERGAAAEPGATASSWEAAVLLRPRGGRPIQVFKRTNVFELSLPLKPHVWSGNFPLVYAFLSLLLCHRIIWFHEGSEGKISASCREGCY